MRIPRLFTVQAGCGRAAVVLVSLLSLALTHPASAEDLPEPVTSELDYFNETIINAEPVNGDALSLDPEPYVNSEPWWHLPQRRVPWYFARARAGGSYFNTPDSTRLGGQYGGDVLVPFRRGFGAYGNISLNHFSEGTQVLGTVGLVKAARRDCSGFIRGSSWLVMFDQYTDTRLHDLYLSSLRVGFTRQLNPDTSIGAIYTEPLEGDRAEFPLIPGAAPISVSLSPTRSIRAFLFRNLDECTQVNGWVGYRDVADTVGYGGGVRHAFNDRVTAIAQATYEDKGLWSGFVGLEFRLGRPNNLCCRATCDHLTDNSAETDVVRGGPKVTEYYFDEEGNIVSLLVKPKKDFKIPFSTYDYFTIQTLLGIQNAAGYGRQVDGMEESMMMMQMMENGGIDFTAECEPLVTQLLMAFDGDTTAAIIALIENMRTDCLGDPRLFGGG